MGVSIGHDLYLGLGLVWSGSCSVSVYWFVFVNVSGFVSVSGPVLGGQVWFRHFLLYSRLLCSCLVCFGLVLCCDCYLL